MASELKFESELIDFLSQIGGTKQWRYVPNIKTNEQLWANFKEILELNNPEIDGELSDAEFTQVKQNISALNTPYQAGKFLYGLNGVSQIEVDMDDGRHLFLTVFDQDQVGAGNTRYQIVNQIERPAVQAGKQNRRFDTTLLINGLPIIQIEEKAEAHDAKEALNQMQQYIDEGQYGDIFSTLQILIGMTPSNIRYMANTTSNLFNTDFAFHWQREKDNTTIRDWREFSTQMLSIPMAHQMATSYMILDGTSQKQMLKVMRPYQVYATKRIIHKLRSMTLGVDDREAGYIWHTTGSGKTISSFKAAWLASRLPNVDKVIFMVDRVALTNQTASSYAAYDPETDLENKGGVVDDTANINDLVRKMKKAGSGIIVTSIQKMDRLVSRKNFKAPDKRIVFIVDEAHRSTAGDMLQRIKAAFRKSAWIGYTGTPSFDGITTQQIFGDLLHAYTIREAIADQNVLGFKVDFNTTLSEETLKTQYLPPFYKAEHPDWTDDDVKIKIDQLTPDDMDDMVTSSVYDMNEEHVRLVVKDILGKWRNRSDDYRYNALFTTHVGGGKASTPMAMMYYDEFQRQNKQLERPLKIAITFSQDTSNSDNMLTTNKSLNRAMADYSKLFGGTYNDQNVAEYTENVVSRLDRKIKNDTRYLDLVIVVDQLLTGFDAPQLNTLYVDRTLKGASLIQAYSRTNRIDDMVHKPFGRIVNYRWPAHTEKIMNDALALYADKNSANLQTELIDDPDGDSEVLAKDFDTLVTETRDVVGDLSDLTNGFHDIPLGEHDQDQMYSLLRKYNGNINKLKQDDQYDYGDPDALLTQIGMDKESEVMLTGTLTNELKEHIAKTRKLDIRDLTLEMTHVHDVSVNYDYLSELIAKLADQVHDNLTDKIAQTFDEVRKLADQIEDRKYANQVKRTADQILQGTVTVDYPMDARNVNQLIDTVNSASMRSEIGHFRTKWGLLDIKSDVIEKLFDRHVKGADDLDVSGVMSLILKQGAQDYRDYAEDEQIKELSKIKYRNELREAFKQFADRVVETY